MGTTVTRPANSRPEPTNSPILAAPSVAVTSARKAVPKMRPVSEHTPDGTSMAILKAASEFAASMTCARAPSTFRVRPVPKTASTTQSNPRNRSGGRSWPSATTRNGKADNVPKQIAGSLDSVPTVHRTTVTSNPRSARCLATTKPSPPLFPGPHSTATVRRCRAAISAATIRAHPAPALSIKTMLGIPMSSMVIRSSSRMVAAVTRVMAKTSDSWPILAHPRTPDKSRRACARAPDSPASSVAS